jgi:phenylalanyl-tRNA synthetase beta chain
METGLETVAYNCNRRNTDLQLFEFGKTYKTSAVGAYEEQQHVSIYITGKKHLDGWREKSGKPDFYFAKGVFEKIMALLGLKIEAYTQYPNQQLDDSVQAAIQKEIIASIGSVNKKVLDRFDIKQPVIFIDINWDKVLQLSSTNKIQYNEIPKFPAATRDLSIVVDKKLRYQEVEQITYGTKVNALKSINLFDVFESEKLGANKKSMAVSYTFLDEEKTMTDKEIDAMMAKIISAYEKELSAEIRK